MASPIRTVVELVQRDRTVATTKSFSQLMQLVQTGSRSLFGSASAYRAMSLTALAWVAVLEAIRFTNKINPDIKQHDATNHHDLGRTAPPRSEQAIQENDQSIAGAHADRHAKFEDADESHHDSRVNISSPPIGSSTDPQILAELRHFSPAFVLTPVQASPAPGPAVQTQIVEAATALPAPVISTPGATATAPAPVTSPVVSSVIASGSGIDGSGNGDLNAGHVVTLTVTMSEVVTVAGGVPTLSLSSGGTATYTGGSGTSALTFSYTVGAGENSGDLAIASINLNGATVSNAVGNSADLSGAVTNPSGILQIDTIAPADPVITTIALGGSGGNHWVLTGPAEANSTVTIFDGGTQLATVTASAVGAWSYTTTGSITNSSVHTFTATASDPAGNSSAPSATWIEGSSGNDTFVFASPVVTLSAPPTR